MDIVVFTIAGVEHRLVRSWILGATYKASWADNTVFDLTIHFATMGPSSHWMWSCLEWKTVAHVLIALGLLEAEKSKEGESGSDIGEGN